MLKDESEKLKKKEMPNSIFQNYCLEIVEPSCIALP
jgi:hypothetical protein